MSAMGKLDATLRRTNADLQVEAAMTPCKCGHPGASHDVCGCEHCDCEQIGGVLASLQRRDAEAVHAATLNLEGRGLGALAYETANAALRYCNSGPFTSDQRGLLLDAARSLTLLAFEVTVG